jgi:flavin-dependent dehydrogenase
LSPFAGGGIAAAAAQAAASKRTKDVEPPNEGGENAKSPFAGGGIAAAAAQAAAARQKLTKSLEEEAQPKSSFAGGVLLPPLHRLRSQEERRTSKLQMRASKMLIHRLREVALLQLQLRQPLQDRN